MNATRSFTAAGQTLDLNVSDAFSEEGVVDVSGTFTGTLVTEGSVDGTTYRALEIWSRWPVVQEWRA